MKRTAMAAAIGSVVALCLTLVTTPAAAQLTARGTETQAVRPNRNLLRSGVAILVASYLPVVGVAATSDRGGDEWLYVPVVGPWADLWSREGCASGGGNCDNERLYEYLLVGVGVAQVVGLVGIISSFIVPEYRLGGSVAQGVRPEVQVAPIQLTKNGYGVGVTGRF